MFRVIDLYYYDLNWEIGQAPLINIEIMLIIMLIYVDAAIHML